MNFLLLIIIAILLFGASAVKSFFGGVLGTILTICLFIGILFCAIWFIKKYNTDKETRHITLFFAWLGAVYFFYEGNLELLGHIVLISGLIYFFRSAVQQKIELEGKDAVILNYKLNIRRFFTSWLGKFVLISILLFLAMMAKIILVH